MRTSGAMVAVLSLSLGSCRACKNEHPFVPYSIDGETPPPAAEAGGDAAPSLEAGSYADASAVVAPPGAARWTLDGLALVAPEGKVFVLGLTGDFDDDGKLDAVTVVRSASGPSFLEAWFYRGGVAPGVRAGFENEVTREPSCSPEPRLARIGPHSVLFEVRVLCAEHSDAGIRHWFGILDLQWAAATTYRSVVIDPDDAPRLTIDAERSDFDHDGQDDLLVRATLEGGGPPFEPGPRASAVLRWFDRRGLSRDRDEPEASLHALAAAAMARASKPKEAATVPALVRQARSLFVALCNEGRHRRLYLTEVDCGSTHALEELALAETRAYVTMGDALRAASALDLAGLAPSTTTPARVTEAKGWIEKIAPPTQATVLRAVDAVPWSERGRTPSWGALAFEPSGKLLVRTPTGVERVDPQTGEESLAGGVTAWQPEVLSPDGTRRLIDAYDPCDAFALRATIVATAGNDAKDVPLPIEPPVGFHCEGTRGTRGTAARAVPIAWGPLGLELVVRGYPVLVSPDLGRAVPLEQPLGQPVTRGAPRSPDGRTFVMPVTEGILVVGARARLLRAKELERAYGELYECAVSDDAARVACARGGRAFVGIWPPP